MEFTAHLRNLRITPRKVDLVLGQIRGKEIGEVLNQLRYSNGKRTAEALSSVLKNAVSMASQKGTVDIDKLVVKAAFVGKGPTLKRFMARAKGSASPILKRTSHITVTLAEK